MLLPLTYQVSVWLILPFSISSWPLVRHKPYFVILIIARTWKILIWCWKIPAIPYEPQYTQHIISSMIQNPIQCILWIYKIIMQTWSIAQFQISTHFHHNIYHHYVFNRHIYTYISGKRPYFDESFNPIADDK